VYRVYIVSLWFKLFIFIFIYIYIYIYVYTLPCLCSGSIFNFCISFYASTCTPVSLFRPLLHDVVLYIYVFYQYFIFIRFSSFSMSFYLYFIHSFLVIFLLSIFFHIFAAYPIYVFFFLSCSFVFHCWLRYFHIQFFYCIGREGNFRSEPDIVIVVI
jgi:hypothetical protein